MPYDSLMDISAVYALSLIYERGGQMGTAIWRVTSLAVNIIANYLLSICIIFLVQMFYTELLSPTQPMWMTKTTYPNPNNGPRYSP